MPQKSSASKAVKAHSERPCRRNQVEPRSHVRQSFNCCSRMHCQAQSFQAATLSLRSSAFSCHARALRSEPAQSCALRSVLRSHVRQSCNCCSRMHCQAQSVQAATLRFGSLQSRFTHALSGHSRPVMCFEISAAQSCQAVFPMMFTHAVSGSAFPGSDASLGSSAVSVHARALRPLVSPSGLAPPPLRPEGQKRRGQRGVYRCKVSVECTGAFRRRVPPLAS